MPNSDKGRRLLYWDGTAPAKIRQKWKKGTFILHDWLSSYHNHTIDYHAGDDIKRLALPLMIVARRKHGTVKVTRNQIVR